MVNYFFALYLKPFCLAWTQSDVGYSLQSTDGRKAQPGLAAEATAVLRETFFLCFFSDSKFIPNSSIHFVKQKKETNMYGFKYIHLFVKIQKRRPVFFIKCKMIFHICLEKNTK